MALHQPAFGRDLNQWRVREDVTRWDVQQETGIPERRLEQLESGVREPTAGELAVVSELLDESA